MEAEEKYMKEQGDGLEESMDIRGAVEKATGVWFYRDGPTESSLLTWGEFDGESLSVPPVSASLQVC